MSGTIPPELAGLTNLEGLWLGDNELSGAIPPELAELTNLERLNLGGNRLNGKIPWELMQLSELTEFDISRTDVCVPTGDDFQAWLATISDFRSSGLACDGSLRVAFSASSYVVREGGSVEVTVRLIDQTEGPARSATIPLTVTPGGGAAGHDDAAVPERVTITAPASVGTFLVTAVEDHHYDHAETITLGFRRPLPSGVTAGSPDTATVTIIDPGTVAMTAREVLEALYEATGGPDWSERANWLSEVPLGEWFGVVTNSNGRGHELGFAWQRAERGDPARPGPTGFSAAVGSRSSVGPRGVAVGRQRVERGDPAGTGRPHQPRRAGSRVQSEPDRDDSASAAPAEARDPELDGDWGLRSLGRLGALPNPRDGREIIIVTVPR